jgi:hypothetical protein
MGSSVTASGTPKLDMRENVNQAHDRGYGPPEEIVPVDKKSRFSG